MPKLTTLTTLAAISDSDLLYIVTGSDGDYTSQVVQATKLLAHVGAHTAYGQISTEANSTGITTTADTWIKITTFDSDDYSYNTVNDVSGTESQVLLDAVGTYKVELSVSAKCTQMKKLRVRVFVGGVEQSHITASEQILSTNQIHGMSAVGIITTAAVDEDVTAYVYVPNSDSTVTVTEAQLVITRLA